MKKIVIKPGIMTGKPVFAGTRIPVELILAKLARGEKTEDILADYPRLEEEDIRGAIAYANKLVQKVQPKDATVSRVQVSR